MIKGRSDHTPPTSPSPRAHHDDLVNFLVVESGHNLLESKLCVNDYGSNESESVAPSHSQMNVHALNAHVAPLEGACPDVRYR